MKKQLTQLRHRDRPFAFLSPLSQGFFDPSAGGSKFTLRRQHADREPGEDDIMAPIV